MSLRLHIECLVLEGLPLKPADGPAVQAAIEAELTRLLGERGLAPGLRNDGALASARGPDVEHVLSPEKLGYQVGRAIHVTLRSIHT